MFLSLITISLMCFLTGCTSSDNSSKSSSSTNTTVSSSEQYIDITPEELLVKTNTGQLKNGEIYQFTAEPLIDQWGMNATNIKYLILVKAFDPELGADDEIMLYSSKDTSNKIISSSSIKFTVKVSNVENTGGDLTVISALPN